MHITPKTLEHLMAEASHGKTVKRINLALQGGGAHGAFTWGVLDRLLEVDWLSLDGISGTSAGAVNAVLLAAGLAEDGREGARARLNDFWRAVALKLPLPPTQDQTLKKWLEPAVRGYMTLVNLLSPYQLNPMDFNPLRALLGERIDFAALRARCPVRLFIAATHIKTGRLRLFTEKELTLESVLASTSLPALHHAVTVQGEAYWDGGFTANPAVFPLIYDCDADDIVAVLLLPLARTEVPKDVDAIRAREAEISFSASFMREMRTVADGRRRASLWSLGGLERSLRRSRFHLIEGEALMRSLDAHSRLNTHEAFLDHLFRQGRQRAELWLQRNFDAIGHTDSIDLDALFGEWPSRVLPDDEDGR